MIKKFKHALILKMDIKGSRSKKVMKGSFSMLLSSFIGNITRLGTVIILSRFYSKEEFGIWATITSTAAVIAYGDFGIIKHANSKNEKRQVTIIKKNKKGENIEEWKADSFILFLQGELMRDLLVGI